MTSRPGEQWRPSASIEAIRRRAWLLSNIRNFFATRGVLEVETPVLSASASVDPQLDSLTTSDADALGRGRRQLYLHTSPEFAMKRLLASGSGPIYQICKAFRAGEAGVQHNPEFTLLEWYRPGFDHVQLMAEVEALVTSVLPNRYSRVPAERVSYADIFRQHAGIDDVHSAGTPVLRACATSHGFELQTPTGDEARDTWLDMLMGFVIAPRLGKGRLTFVVDYPPSQAALARIRSGGRPVAERFELFVDGMELANGFHELTDSEEQRRRFREDLALRARRGLPQPPLDEHLLAALASGLPDCAGVALGVDRLLMRLMGGANIDAVLAFPISRA